MPSPGHSESLQRVWLRVAARVGASAARGRRLITVLRRDMRRLRLAGGGQVLVVYSAAGVACRHGQAQRVRLVGLSAGARCRLSMLPGLDWECLVLAGEIAVGGEQLGPLDHHHRPAGPLRIGLFSAEGARLLVRESRPVPGGGSLATQRAARSAWQHLPLGIGRRQLGGVGTQRISLQRLTPGSALPAHRHSDDEECLLLEGEMFVEDRLLRAGDYQVAPAGTVHHAVITAAGALLYRRGDADLDADLDAALGGRS
jgi:hypothetical protein